FFFQAEDGIRDFHVTGVQTCALPIWRWTAAYGAATTRAIAEVHLNEPALDLTVRHDPEEWADRLGGHVTPTGTVRTTRRGAVDTLPGYSDGAWWVQDKIGRAHV